MKDREKAMQAVEKALTLSPNAAADLAELASVRMQLGQYKKALDHCDKALQVAPGCLDAIVVKAALRASCPEAAIRNGAEALKLAVGANDGASEWCKRITVLCLADAHAECGDFKEALRLTKEAIRLGGTESEADPLLLERLSLYQNGQPYRMRAIPSISKE